MNFKSQFRCIIIANLAKDDNVDCLIAPQRNILVKDMARNNAFLSLK